MPFHKGNEEMWNALTKILKPYLMRFWQGIAPKLSDFPPSDLRISVLTFRKEAWQGDGFWSSNESNVTNPARIIRSYDWASFDLFECPLNSRSHLQSFVGAENHDLSARFIRAGYARSRGASSKYHTKRLYEIPPTSRPE